jgi:hypothetical protein
VRKTIATQEAVIQTVSVEIKTLTLSGKMTLAVFRQLQREPLFDLRTRDIQGVPWGWVNYHKDCPSTEHFHVIWQKGSELRKDYVYERYHGDVLDDLRSEWLSLRRCWLIFRVEDEEPTMEGQPVSEVSYVPSEGKIGFSSDAGVYTMDREDLNAIREHWKKKRQIRTWPVAGPSYEDLKSRCERQVVQRGLESQAAIGAKLDEISRESRSLHPWWLDQWEMIRSLDQLFIAV